MSKNKGGMLSVKNLLRTERILFLLCMVAALFTLLLVTNIFLGFGMSNPRKIQMLILVSGTVFFLIFPEMKGFFISISERAQVISYNIMHSYSTVFALYLACKQLYNWRLISFLPILFAMPFTAAWMVNIAVNRAWGRGLKFENGTNHIDIFESGKGLSTGLVSWLLKIENLCFGLIFIYLAFYQNPIVGLVSFVLLLLLPDISFIGYLFGKKKGALLYNIAHSFVVPIIFTLVSFYCLSYASNLARAPMESLNNLPALLLKIGELWIAHIFFDRFLGFGLKYEKGFAYTHLGMIKNIFKGK